VCGSAPERLKGGIRFEGLGDLGDALGSVGAFAITVDSTELVVSQAEKGIESRT
jgi:hypothetical protein